MVATDLLCDRWRVNKHYLHLIIYPVLLRLKPCISPGEEWRSRMPVRQRFNRFLFNKQSRHCVCVIASVCFTAAAQIQLGLSAYRRSSKGTPQPPSCPRAAIHSIEARSTRVLKE